MIEELERGISFSTMVVIDDGEPKDTLSGTSYGDFKWSVLLEAVKKRGARLP